MKFFIKEKMNRRDFIIIYNNEDHFFDIEPFDRNHNNFTSLAVSFLQVGIDYDKRLTYVWGYEPLIRYHETNKFPSVYESNDLVAVIDEALVPGVSISLDKEKEWQTYINKKMGWVCVGDPTTEGRRLIEFAPDCVAALDHENEMVAVWLHPKELPAHVFENNDKDEPPRYYGYKLLNEMWNKAKSLI